MNKKLFLSRVQQRMKTLSIRSERALLIGAKVSPDVLRKLKQPASRGMHHTTINKIAAALDVPVAWLTGESDEISSVGKQAPNAGGIMEGVEIIGEVKAGNWIEAVEWDKSERDTLWLPRDHRYAGLKRYALRVAGGSMDKIFPHGSHIVVVRLADLKRDPQHKDIVVVHAKRPGLWEATCKVYTVRPDGTIWLEPRSSDARYRPMQLGDDGSSLPKDVNSVEMFALVTGSYVEL